MSPKSLLKKLDHTSSAMKPGMAYGMMISARYTFWPRMRGSLKVTARKSPSAKVVTTESTAKRTVQTKIRMEEVATDPAVGQHVGVVQRADAGRPGLVGDAVAVGVGEELPVPGHDRGVGTVPVAASVIVSAASS